MAEVLDGVVESDMPDLTRVPLADLFAVSMPPVVAVLDRAIQHPAQDKQEQQN
jgi:hypothetical protein